MGLRGNRVRQRRTEMHLSQADLGERIGTDQNRISRYERGESDATGETLAALAKILETSVDWLLGLTDDPTPAIERNDLSQNERAAIAAWRRGDRAEAAKVILNG